MNWFDILDRSFDFGTFRSRDSVFSFTIKIILYIIPAVVFGAYTDKMIQTLYGYKIFGESMISYVIAQTGLIILTMYVLISIFENFTSEFQKTTAGTYFIVLYFGLQTDYIKMIKDVVRSPM